MRYRIAIGYTNKLFSDGLEAMIEGFDSYTVVKSFPVEDNHSLHIEHKTGIDILIIELSDPDRNTIVFLNKLKEEFPLIHVMIISNRPGIELSRKLIDCGIDAYLLKSCTRHDIWAALIKITSGESYFSKEILKRKSIVHTDD